MSHSTNPLNVSMMNIEKTTHTKSGHISGSKLDRISNGELFYSGMLINDSKRRILDSKQILEKTLVLKYRIDRANFF